MKLSMHETHAIAQRIGRPTAALICSFARFKRLSSSCVELIANPSYRSRMLHVGRFALGIPIPKEGVFVYEQCDPTHIAGKTEHASHEKIGHYMSDKGDSDHVPADEVPTACRSGAAMSNPQWDRFAHARDRVETDGDTKTR
jgi:hypothetical protein